MSNRILLACGALSSLYYTALVYLIPISDPNYHSASQVVSELSAIGAPTRTIWVVMCIPYTVLFAAFGWGVYRSAGPSRKFRMLGILIMAYCTFGIYWPPMQQRGQEMALTDILHIVWASVTLLFMMLFMGLGASALGKLFRSFTAACFVVFLIFGTLTSLDSPKLAINEPTPYIGIWERINIAAYMLWVIVFSAILLKREPRTD